MRALAGRCMRPSTRATVSLLLVFATVAGCGVPAQLRLANSVPWPARHVTVAAEALPEGIESMYELFNTGSWESADRLLQDDWTVPRFAPAHLATPLTWHEDPYHEQYWRFIFYSLRPTNSLLWAYYRSGKSQYRDKLLEILRSYLAHVATNPARDRYGMDDPHTVAFRVMGLVNDYVKLRRSHDLPADLDSRLRQEISRLAHLLETPRYYQGTYNHGFNEAVALLLVSANFPEFDPRGEWRNLSQVRLMDLMKQAVGTDGVEVEKSPFYHYYVLDFALQLEEWAQRNQIALPSGFHDRVEAMVRFATYLIWPDGTIPLVGSSVEMRPSRSADLYTAFEREHPDFAYAVSAGASGTAPPDRAALFDYTGLAVLRSPVDQAARYSDNSQLILDVGPQTSPHAQVEALAFDYYSHGRELITDSGLDTYVPGTAFDYFHNATAHNTVVVDGQNQGSGPVRSGLTATGPTWAYQSGSASVYPGVTQRRAVLLLSRDLVLVVDLAGAQQEHRYNQLWHLFPGAHVVADGTRVDVYDDRDAPTLRIVQADMALPLGVVDHFGEMNPMQGWYSDQYGHVERVHVADYGTQGLQAAYVTVLASGPYAGRAVTARAQVVGEGVTATVCAGGYAATVVIGHLAAVGESVTVNEGVGECT